MSKNICDLIYERDYKRLKKTKPPKRLGIVESLNTFIQKPPSKKPPTRQPKSKSVKIDINSQFKGLSDSITALNSKIDIIHKQLHCLVVKQNEAPQASISPIPLQSSVSITTSPTDMQRVYEGRYMSIIQNLQHKIRDLNALHITTTKELVAKNEFLSLELKKRSH